MRELSNYSAQKNGTPLMMGQRPYRRAGDPQRRLCGLCGVTLPAEVEGAPDTTQTTTTRHGQLLQLHYRQHCMSYLAILV
jgi:hypothetical protein